MNEERYPHLYRIRSPEDLRAMPESDMPALCDEIRNYLVENVTKTGGHLASNLGVVEMTVALHRVFHSPDDRILFDVGHQSYVHKLLTGRADRFDTLRQPGGLCGFTRRSESVHDPFGAGHSSTSLSAALGFAEADRLAGRKNYTVAVLGDGAYTGGMIHEALNNCRKDLRLIILLNENEMSISRNIGGFAKYIARIRASRKYAQAKSDTKTFLGSLPLIGQPLYRGIRRVKNFFKNLLYSSNYFEHLGLYYIGPGDGNDFGTVLRLIEQAKQKEKSVIVHLRTVKGKGFAPAEKEPNRYHGIPPEGTPEVVNYSAMMGQNLCRMAGSDERLCAVTAAMCEGTGLVPFRDAFRKRFFDVGIAEEHALTFCAGLAAAGMRPVFAVYSSFLQRGYDNLIHDIALQHLPVTLMIDRASLSSGDGPTHHGIYDVAMLGAIPGFRLFAPLSFASLSAAMTQAVGAGCPAAVRYPNAGENESLIRAFSIDASLSPHPDYDPETPPECLLVTYGKIASEALRAEVLLQTRGIRTGVLLLQKLYPIDECAAEVLPYLRGCSHVVFLEEGVRQGGAGMLLFDTLSRMETSPLSGIRYDIVAIDDAFVVGEAGKTAYASAGISAEDVCRRVMFQRSTTGDVQRENPF